MTRQKVEGIGGVFLRAKDPKSLMSWFEQHLGISQEWPHGHSFPWRKEEAPDEKGMTAWSLFPQETEYFGNQAQAAMVNYRVRDLDAMLAQLEAEGVEIILNREESEYGRFAWIVDPEGNRIELWQPPA